MAIQLTSPIFSFLQFTEDTEACVWTERPCLPVYELEDLQFQILAEVTGNNKSDFPLVEGNSIYGSVSLDCEVNILSEQNYSSTWVKYETGEGENPDKYVGYFSYNIGNIWDLISIGECFSIMIYTGSYSLGCFDTCFKKIAYDCFTSVLAYRNNENAFGFRYDNPTYNRVRLYFYPHSPSNTEENKSYAKSDGSTVLLTYRLWKDYKVKVDYMLQSWIERFTVATAHDDVRITSDYAALNQDAFVRIEKVEPAWNEEQIPQFNMAQSSTVLRLAAVRENVNSNCS